jgi:hypothetical protein
VQDSPLLFLPPLGALASMLFWLGHTALKACRKAV